MKWDGKKFITDYPDENWPLEKYYFALKKVKSTDRVIDAACGRGYGSFLLAQKAKEVIGLDIDEPSLSDAIADFKLNNLKFLKGNVAKLDFDDNSFDVFVSIETIEHLNEQDQNKFLMEIKRVLKPNGVLILSTPDHYVALKQGIIYGDFHEKEFIKKEFVNFIKLTGFKDIQIFGQGKFTEPTAVRKILNFLKRIDFLNLRKIKFIKKWVKQADVATSPIDFDYNVYKLAGDNELASHIIIVGHNRK